MAILLVSERPSIILFNQIKNSVNKNRECFFLGHCTLNTIELYIHDSEFLLTITKKINIKKKSCNSVEYETIILYEFS